MKLTNSDLLNNRYKYSINILQENVVHLDKKILLATQTLTHFEIKKVCVYIFFLIFLIFLILQMNK